MFAPSKINEINGTAISGIPYGPFILIILRTGKHAFPLERKRQSGSIGPFSPFPWAVRNAREERKAAPIDNARLLSFSYAFLYTRIKEKKRKRKGL